MGIRQRLTVCSIAALVICWSTFPSAWGHLRELKESPDDSLAMVAIKQGFVVTCVENSSSRFDKTSLSIQVNGAVRIYLRILADALHTYFSFKSTDDCGQANLVVRTVRSTDSAVGFDADDVRPASESRLANGRHRISLYLDYKTTAGATLFDYGTLEESFPNRRTIGQEILFLVGESDKGQGLGRAPSASEMPAYYRNQSLARSTWPVLLHEVGHSFGLCDQYVLGRRNCDPEWRSPQRNEPTVMRGDTFFVLTPDDAAGVVALAQRFQPEFQKVSDQKGLPSIAPADLKGPPSGSKKTKTGLEYKVIRQGNGALRPKTSDIVYFRYTSWRSDGRMVSNSYAIGSTSIKTKPSQVSQVLGEALQLMVEGEQARFWSPESWPGTPHGLSIMDVELIKIGE